MQITNAVPENKDEYHFHHREKQIIEIIYFSVELVPSNSDVPKFIILIDPQG